MNGKDVGFYTPNVVELLRYMIGGDMHHAASAFSDARGEYGSLHISAQEAIKNYKRAYDAMQALDAKDEKAVHAYLREEYAAVKKRIAKWESAPAHYVGREMTLLVFGMRKATIEEFLPPAHRNARSS